MTVDSLQPQNPNTIQSPVHPRVDNTDPVRQNRQAASDTLSGEATTRTGQEAFQVQISSQARERLAADSPDRTQETEPQTALSPETPPVSRTEQGPGSSRLIDILG